jgi:hypothetical protein
MRFIEKTLSVSDKCTPSNGTLICEQCTEANLEGSGRGLVKALSQTFFKRMRKPQRPSIRMADVQAMTRIDHLPNISSEHYRHINLLVLLLLKFVLAYR